MLTFIGDEIEQYVSSRTSPESPLLTELTRETVLQMAIPEMLSGHVQGRFLKMIVQLSRARSILEIGTFTGYSALCLAEGLPDGGTLVTLDNNPAAIGIATKFINKSGLSNKITVKEGDALGSIGSLTGPFDLVFIDADKTNYPNYYDAVMPLLSQNGVILIDNSLWGGAVLSPNSPEAVAIDQLNRRIAADPRVDAVLLTLRDGLFVVRKK